MMLNWNSYWSHGIVLFIIIVFCIEKSSAQFVAINCWECSNCTDPFTVTSAVSNVTGCYSCYKMSVTVAYAPYSYVIRRCLPACLETSQQFGGGVITVTCCATPYCNTSSMIKFPFTSRFFLLLFIICAFLKRFY